MAVARSKTDGEGDEICQQFTELSDVIRAKNKREDRLLNIQLRFYEREKNIRLNIIRKEKHQLERVRTSLFEETKKIQLKKQNLSLSLWMSPRPKSKAPIVVQQSIPKVTVTDWELKSNLIQSEIMSSNTTDNTLTTTEVIRRHSAR